MRDRTPRQAQSDRADPEQPTLPHSSLRGLQSSLRGLQSSLRGQNRYALSLLLTILASAFNYIFHTRISPTNLVMPYLLVVVFCAAYLGRGPAIFASVLSVLVFDFFFVPPYLTLAVNDTEYLLTFFGLLIVGLVISELTTRVRDQAEIARKRAEDTSALYGLSRDLAAAADLEGILAAIDDNICRTFQRDAFILLPDPENPGGVGLYSKNEKYRLEHSEREVAAWVFQHERSAEHDEGKLSSAEAVYLPLKTAQGVIGVLGAKPGREIRPLTTEQSRLLETFARQTALAIERVQFEEQARRTQLLQAKEKLQAALLNSISHDLRTPLVSITGALSSLHEDADQLPVETRQNLVDMAYEDAGRLNQLVANLLNMTRIEAGSLQLDLLPCDIQDLVGSALRQLGSRTSEHVIRVQIPEDLPLAPMDFVLMVQVLVNLLDNAIKYSPPETIIEIQAGLEGGNLSLRVLDCGPGILPEDLPQIFDKFYRGKGPKNVGGTGLGLAICKGIVEAHGGRILAANRPSGGSVFSVWLPLNEAKRDG
jgi:two-component system sensor histidine kinase KdpD